ncbi:hypothetical protein [Paenibacillus aceti]|uniref:ABC transporter permease n=1 Tax=Paenibacillus aceti TaxID=1820010 RepID=A0ABQ1VYC6_9BACL|nr:hypothetical protein [Paenibacillus aceti]GGG04187.1 hypothetical protein GCM10010913_27470 [Paenibacillus aceti]
MMRLLKYDWKKNGTMLLSTAVILILTEAALLIAGYSRGWDEAFIVAMSIMLYVFASMLAVIMSYKTFHSNIKSYSRRLLPVRTVWSVLSPMALGILILVGLLIIICLHILIFSWLYSEPNVSELLKYFFTTELAIVIFQLFFAYMYSYMAVALSIAIACTFRKWRVWIGILSFILIQNVISWLIFKLFDSGLGKSSFLNVGVTSHFDINGEVFIPPDVTIINWGETLVELAIAGLMLGATVLLLNRRVEA